MSDPTETPQNPGEATPPDASYVVVARRYRPQTFDELIGQEHISRTLAGAIAANRVGHAYLFTGARGVGKTSAARILAKALDCTQGPTAKPCNECEICVSISTGDDVDVLEIDGASNRGIDEIRQLRSNVNVRPSRARYKIYIIDEVHMLTREAFNALLKTLEEPPGHVKFIFCTTEPNKIPITVLSRCQRFDFAGIEADSIVTRLAQIAEAEGVTADADALQILARRAAGSMRDSQSLLEQLLAFGESHITAKNVHEMLGTADTTRLLAMADSLASRDAATALSTLDEALAEGVDVGQLLEQLLGIFRDAMVALAGCPDKAFLHALSSDEQAGIRRIGSNLGLETTLALLQIIEQAVSSLRYTAHGRTVAEVALVRCCNLENLDGIANLVAQLREGGSSEPAAKGSGAVRTASASKKKPEPPAGATTPDSLPAAVASPADTLASTSGDDDESQVETPSDERLSLEEADAKAIWESALEKLSGLVTAKAKEYSAVAIPAPNRLVVSFDETYNLCKSFCERPEQVEKIERALSEVTGSEVRVVFNLVVDEKAAKTQKAKPPAVSRQQKMAAASNEQIIRRARELFGARPVDVDDS